MGQYSWKNAYSNLGVKLFDPDIFKEDEKHYGKTNIGTGQILYMLARTQSMFEYEGLPDTIPARNLEMMLQLNGNVFFTDAPGDFYIFTGGLGGEPDVYYEPTLYTVANPALNFSRQLKINEDGVLIRSDSYMVGLLPMMQKYAALMVENEFSMRIADINSRISFLLSAADDRTEKSARAFLERIVNGDMGVISESAFLESLKVNNAGTQNSIRLTDLIEYQQYLKAAWFNDLGINANYNMKRESISPDAAQLHDEALLPFIDDMLKCRKLAFDNINEKYGLNIKVKLSSSWLNEQEKQEVTGTPNADDYILTTPGPLEVPDSQDDETEDPEEVTEETEEATEETEEVT
ncbi:MAG: hypothetical protein J6S49_06550 [Erysipelotrichaceae bacterium]|nr:hypothetical protein [Erysipelotrichaceae bacterium]